MKNRDKWNDDSPLIDETDIFGIDEDNDEDLIDESDRVSDGSTYDDRIFIDDSTLMPPEVVVGGKSLYYAYTYEDYRAYLNHIYNTPYSELVIGYDIETNAESPLSTEARIIGFSISPNSNEGIYVIRESLDYIMPDDQWNSVVEDTVELFKKSSKRVVHNIGYELPYTVNQWDYLLPEETTHDTMIMLRTTYPKLPAGLKPASARILGYSDWDADLSTFVRSSKTLINSVVGLTRSKGRARNTTKLSSLYLVDNLFTVDNRKSMTEILTNCPSPSEGIQTYTYRDKVLDAKNSVFDSFTDILNVMESYGLLEDDKLINTYVDEIMKMVLAGGLTTDVVPYSLIPSKIISQYGALDSIATIELYYDTLRVMDTKSAEIRKLQDELSGVPGQSTFNLYDGYEVVKKQYYAGQYLEMAGAYWNDDVATRERQDNNDRAVRSWKKLVKIPKIFEAVLQANSEWYVSDAVKSDFLALYDAGLYQSRVQLSEVDLIESENRLRNDHPDTYMYLMKLYDHLHTIYDDGLESSFTIQKTQVKFWNKLVDNPKDPDTAIPWTVRYRSVWDEVVSISPELTDYYSIVVTTDRLNKEIDAVESFNDTKSILNLASVKAVEVLEKGLINPQVLLGKVFYDLVAWTSDDNNYEEYWQFSGVVSPGLDSTKELFDFIIEYRDAPDDEKSDYYFGRRSYSKFYDLLMKAVQSDVRLATVVDDTMTTFDLTKEGLSEGVAIRLYQYMYYSGDHPDLPENEWSDHYKAMYYFRLYKKCVKLITSYIDGTVGRKSVQMTTRDIVNGNALLAYRSGSYYSYGYEKSSDIDPKLMPLLTIRFKVGMAETGRWTCLSGDTKIPLFDGRVLTMKELVKEKDFYVYSYDHQLGKIVPGLAKASFESGYDADMVRITLDNDEYIDCTPEHLIMLRSGHYKRADELVDGESLMTRSSNDTVVSVIKLPKSPVVYDLHVEKHHNFAVESGVIVHNSGIHTIPDGTNIKNIFTSRFEGGTIVNPDYCLVGDTRIKLLDGSSPTIKELADTYGLDKTYEVYSYDHESGEVRPGVARNTRVTKVTDKVYRITLDNDKVVETTDNHPFMTRDGEYVRADQLEVGTSLMPMYWGISKMYEMAKTHNHKVKSIEVIDKVTEVYDLEVDDYHNFLIDLGDNSGVFVHNSQLEVRVIGASAGEEVLLEAFRQGIDIHGEIAKTTWNKSQVSDAERRYSKMVTFAILYGSDEHNIARNFMNGDIERATTLVNNFYAGYPKLKKWIDMKHEEWKKTSHVTLMTGRIIKIPTPDRSDPKYFGKYSKGLRSSQNYPINY